MIEKVKELYKKKEIEYSNELQEKYSYYTEKVSDKVMPASMRCCVFLICMYEIVEPKIILDLGSGFSSYALRYFKEKFSRDTTIYSIDNHWWWLKLSREFCENNSVESDNFFLWSEIEDKRIPCELIFMDIEFRDRRLKYYDPVCEKFLSKRTFMLLDDMHMGILREKVRNIKHKYIKHQVLYETIVHNRFSWLLEFISE